MIFRNGSARTTRKKVKGPRTTSNDIDNVFTKVQYPKDVQFLDELNRENEEKYKKWLRKRRLAEKILGERTLIIGVRGKDGIVLGGDTKVMRGSEKLISRKKSGLSRP